MKKECSISSKIPRSGAAIAITAPLFALSLLPALTSAGIISSQLDHSIDTRVIERGFDCIPLAATSTRSLGNLTLYFGTNTFSNINPSIATPNWIVHVGLYSSPDCILGNTAFALYKDSYQPTADNTAHTFDASLGFWDATFASYRGYGSQAVSTSTPSFANARSIAFWVSRATTPTFSSNGGYPCSGYCAPYLQGNGTTTAYLLEDDVPAATTTPPCAVNCNSNVLFLPGIEASRLYRPQVVGDPDKRLWEPLGDADALELAMTSTGSSARPDIYTKKGDVLDEAYVSEVGPNVYKSFIADMNDLKADEKIADWEAAPYDWRLSLEDIVTHGAQIGDTVSYLGNTTETPYIEQELRRLASSSRTHKVTIIAHSNGGLVAKALMQKLGTTTTAELIDKVIFVASPQVGTPQAVGAILHGYEQGLPKDWLPFLLTPETARDMAQNMPGVYGLLPSYSYFTYTDDPVIEFDDSLLLAPWRAKYGDRIHSTERLREFMTDTSRPAMPTAEDIKDPITANPTLLSRAEISHNIGIDTWVPPEGVRVIEIAGWGEDTLKTVHYYQGTAGTCTQRREDSTCAVITQTPVLDYRMDMTVDGDGTVVVPSALWTTGSERYWVDLTEYNDGFIGTNIDRKHADLLEVSHLRHLLQNLIGNVVSIDNENKDVIFGTMPISGSTDVRLHFTLHSPLTLDLFDDLGNHTGISTSTGHLEENIPGSRYRVFGGVTYATAPASTTIQAIMRGLDEGSFTLDVEESQGDVIIASTTFAGIPSSTTTVASIIIPQDGGIASSSPLTVDENGDGNTDLTLEPQLGDIVIPPKPTLTFTADSKTITLGDAIPPLSGTLSGFIGGDTATSSVSGLPDCMTTATTTSPVGTYPVTCTVGTLTSDVYDFNTFVPGTLTIRYRFDGFLQPINDTTYHPEQNQSVFKGGSTVPVKFQLKNASGASVQASTTPIWLTPQQGNALAATVGETTYSDPASSGSMFRWDSANQQYIYNWSTKGVAAGYWYRISAKLDDGKIYSVMVGVR